MAIPTTIRPGTSVRIYIAVRVDCLATLIVDADFTNIVWEQREGNNRRNLAMTAYCVE